jgi:23S rRNA pseudouridine1911/1915/1917 synthase
VTGRGGHEAPEDGDEDAGDDDLGIEERRLPVDAAGRVDTFVAAHVPELTRAQVKRLIDDGDVRVGGAAVTKAGHKLRAGDEVVVVLRPPVPIDVVAEDIPLAVLFEDGHLIAIDKPPGLVVHPAPGHPSGTLVNALLHHCRGELAGIGGAIRPGIVHRLDKDTSGVMVVAKDEPTHLALAAAFKAKSEAGAAGAAPPPGGVVREYLAVVAPAPEADEGTIRTLYGRHPTHRKKFSSRVAAGKPAVTHWRVAERFPAGAALVRCRLATGRTHQIRVHLADAGWPLLGDALYGRRGRTPRLSALSAALGRQALHAERLELTHPATGERLDLRAPLPADLVHLLAELRTP